MSCGRSASRVAARVWFSISRPSEVRKIQRNEKRSPPVHMLPRQGTPMSCNNVFPLSSRVTVLIQGCETRRGTHGKADRIRTCIHPGSRHRSATGRLTRLGCSWRVSSSSAKSLRRSADSRHRSRWRAWRSLRWRSNSPGESEKRHALQYRRLHRRYEIPHLNRNRQRNTTMIQETR